MSASMVHCKAGPNPSKLVEISGLYHRATDPKMHEAQIIYKTRDDNLLNAYIYRATGLAEKTGTIVFINHGASRNAEDYLLRFKPMSEQTAALAISSKFPKTICAPNHDPFTLGTETNKTPNTETYSHSKLTGFSSQAFTKKKS